MNPDDFASDKPARDCAGSSIDRSIDTPSRCPSMRYYASHAEEATNAYVTR